MQMYLEHLFQALVSGGKLKVKQNYLLGLMSKS